MSEYTERYEAALYHVEGLVLDCVTGFSDDSKTVKQVVADIYAVGDKIGETLITNAMLYQLSPVTSNESALYLA